MTERTPYDGKPYYCADCGLGWPEVRACEDGPCTLEKIETAQKRRRAHLAREHGLPEAKPVKGARA